MSDLAGNPDDFAILVGMVDADPATGCWLWRGRVDRGYARVVALGVLSTVHRLIWQHARGQRLDRKIQLDHMCRNRDCVRPAHMDPVTNAENQRRVTRRNREQITVCPQGHVLDGENGVQTANGGTICVSCCKIGA